MNSGKETHVYPQITTFPECCCSVPKSCRALFNAMDCSLPGFSVSVRFPRQESWSGLPLPPGDLPNAGIKPASLAPPALAGGFFSTRTTWEAHSISTLLLFPKASPTAASSLLEVCRQRRLALQVSNPTYPGPSSPWGGSHSLQLLTSILFHFPHSSLFQHLCSLLLCLTPLISHLGRDCFPKVPCTDPVTSPGASSKWVLQG